METSKTGSEAVDEAETVVVNVDDRESDDPTGNQLEHFLNTNNLCFSFCKCVISF